MAAARPEGFTVTLHTEGERTVVAVRGELDLSTAGLLRDTLADLHGTGACEVVLDAERLDFCDSTGLSVLLGAARRWQQGGGRLLLHRPSPALTRLLDLAGVRQVFPVTDD